MAVYIIPFFLRERLKISILFLQRSRALYSNNLSLINHAYTCDHIVNNSLRSMGDANNLYIHTVTKCLENGPLNSMVRGQINGGCGLIKEYDTRVLHNRPCQSYHSNRRRGYSLGATIMEKAGEFSNIHQSIVYHKKVQKSLDLTGPELG